MHKEQNYKIVDICAALDLNRSTLYSKLQKKQNKKESKTNKAINGLNRKLLFEIIEIKRNHPFRGYRRVWAFIKSKKVMVI